MKRFLLIGSAPSSKIWLDHNVVPPDVIVCAINNSWSIVRDRMNRWYTAGDFFHCGHVIPTKEDMAKYFWRQGGMSHGCVINSFVQKPYWYKSPCDGTMILNCLYDLINRHHPDNEQANIYIIGCDLVYNGNNTHFYGKGEPDPLRAGKEWLEKALADLNSMVNDDKVNAHIFNLSEGETLLPFRKGELK